MRAVEFIAEGGAETSWSDGNEKITLQDILELTKHVRPINLAINDNLKSKLIHWDGNPEEIERINQVTVSNQFPILIIVDEQGDIQFILDGNHRLHKAIRAQAKTIPAKLIKPSDLSDKAKRIFHIQEQGVAEYRKGAYRQVKKLLPKWPDYVVKDMMYKQINRSQDLAPLQSWTKERAAEIDHWEFDRGMLLTKNMLNPHTLMQMREREFGNRNPWKVPKDEERMIHALDIVKQKGMENLPPIIMIKTPQGYELWEGWHRTMAAFTLHPGGFKVNAYIGYRTKDQDDQQDIAEAPLPQDWDPEKINLQQRFPDRIKYVVDRARRISSGSARVAFEIDYQGRPTVIKVAKNAKGLLQNAAEISILRNADTGSMPIVIPLIDFDQANAQPVWLQTEMAKRVRRDTLLKLLHAPNLWLLIECVEILLDRVKTYRKYNTLPDIKKEWYNSLWRKNNPPTEQDWQIFLTYAKELAELARKTTIEIWDLNSPSNWGVFNNRPVVLDLGFTTEVWQAIRDQT